MRYQKCRLSNIVTQRDYKLLKKLPDTKFNQLKPSDIIRLKGMGWVDVWNQDLLITWAGREIIDSYTN